MDFPAILKLVEEAKAKAEASHANYLMAIFPWLAYEDAAAFAREINQNTK